MSLYLILIGLLIVLALIIIALVYKNRADAKAHYAAIQATIAQAAQAQNTHEEQLDKSMHTLQTEQRHENTEAPKHYAARADFDNDWSGMPTELTGNNAANRAAEPSGTASAAGDHSNRVDLSE